MKTRLAGNFREPYVRGPHIRYFFISIVIAFIIAIMSMIGVLSLIRVINS